MAQTLQQFPGTDDFYAFVGMGEMLLVASYYVIRARCCGTFIDAVVGLMSGYSHRLGGMHEPSLASNIG